MSLWYSGGSTIPGRMNGQRRPRMSREVYRIFPETYISFFLLSIVETFMYLELFPYSTVFHRSGLCQLLSQNSKAPGNAVRIGLMRLLPCIPKRRKVLNLEVSCTPKDLFDKLQKSTPNLKGQGPLQPLQILLQKFE